MKILIFSGFGSCTLTPTMKQIMNSNKFPFNRVGKIVEYIEKTAVNKTGCDRDELKKWLYSNKENIAYCEEFNEKIYLVQSDYCDWDTFSIRQVDISRPWTIEEYDGSEYIKYLDEYVAVKELNYYNIKK